MGILTTAKSNVGHLEGGAGMTGFLKCIVQVCHAEMSTNVHLRALNPHLEVDGFSQIYLSESIVCASQTSLGGVSSFGFGGTNGHSSAYGKNSYTSRNLGMRHA